MTLHDIRSRWGVALQAIDREQVLSLAARITSTYPARHTRTPSAGLVMLQMRDSVLGEHFNMGEVPVSEARIALSVGTSDDVIGGARIMKDDAELAEAIAVCDAVLAHDLEHQVEVAQLVEEGIARLDGRERVRRGIRCLTRVDFALLNQTLDEEDEA